MNTSSSEPRLAWTAKGIIVIYFLFGALCELLSDRLLKAFVKEPDVLTRFQTYKGWFYLIITTAVLYFFMQRYSQATQRYIANLNEAEAALYETKDRLNLALKSAYTGTWEYEIEKDMLTWDEHIDAKLGLASGTGTSAHRMKDFLEMVHPEDREFLSTALTGAMESKTDVNVEYRIVWLDGSVHHVATRGKIYCDEAGRNLRVVGISMDLTKQRQIEAAVRASEESYRSLFENMLEGFTYCQMLFEDNRPRDFVILDVNRAFKDLIGVENLIGKKAGEIFPHLREYYSEMLEVFGRVSLTGRPEKLEVYLEPLATWLFISAYTTGKGYFFAVFSDITKQKEAENALRESERRFRETLESIEMAAVIIDLEGNITFCNDFFLNLSGYERHELVGVNWFDTFIYDETKDVRKSAYRSEVLDGTMPIHYERELPTRSGERRLIVWNSAFLRDPKGRVIGASSLGRDVTEQRKLEVQLRQAQKMEALGTLAGGIAHDFNNILSAAMGYTELALMDAPKGSSQRARLQEVLKASKRAGDLVKQILAFSRQSEQKRQPIEISLIVKEALKLLRASLPATIAVRFEIETKGLLMADPTQMHQVLMNLCTNASHAMQEDGGTLLVSLTDVDLDLEAVTSEPGMKPGPYVRLSVSDTGQGIEDSVKARIFDPFFTTKGPGEGTGMGLAVVHGIVKSHGGFIRVDSKPGQGTEFRMYFPRLKAVTAPERQDEEIIPGGSERILFVDDEPALANLGKAALERLGYRVVGTTGSMEALEAFRNRPYEMPFDLVITDLTMPHMTGLQLAQELLHLQPELPVILCSGFSEAITPENAKHLGIRAFLMKPLVVKQLAEAVRKALDER
ncbi:MAG: PAS domain S-box protein [Syntrophobacteraceae bacterium]